MTYISVDVETSGLLVGEFYLLSVGAVDCDNLDNQFHEVLMPFEARDIHWDKDTKAWWDTQEAASLRLTEQWNLQYSDVKPQPWEVFEPACKRFEIWLSQFETPIFFVAWPASFDYPWVQNWFFETETVNPFSYRTIDVKSYACGKLGIDFNVSHEEMPALMNETPEFPHDALSDAIAQAKVFNSLRKFNSGVPEVHDGN